MRHPDRPDRYLLSRSRAPYLVVDADIMEFTLENEPVSHDERALYAGRAIHARIYAARPDVAAICHKHAPATIPFGVTGTDLRPIFHMASTIGASIPIWDIADRFGDTNVLVTKYEMGDDLAHMLGSHRVARSAATAASSPVRRCAKTSSPRYIGKRMPNRSPQPSVLARFAL